MSTPADLYLGVDGGGTGCRCRLETAAGEVLGSGIAGPASLRLGLEASLASVMQAARGAIAEAGLAEADFARVRASICLAGIGRKGIREDLAAWNSPFAQTVFESDGLAACLGAHDGEDGGIVIIGALLQIGSGNWLVVILASLSVLIATINIVGGFLVTRRMLAMFQNSLAV